MNYDTVAVHIATLRIGDTVLHEGHLKTVGRENYRRNEGIGFTLFGDSYMSGIKPVEKVIFNRIKLKL